MLRAHHLSSRSLWTDESLTFLEATGHGIEANNFLSTLSRKEYPQLLTAKDFKRFLKVEPHETIKDVSRGILHTDTHPPLYFWIIHIWMKPFGDGLLAVRAFSLLMGMISILLAYKMGAYLFSKEVGDYCALFTAICAFSVRFSQEARAYSLIMAIGLAAGLCILRLQRFNKNSDAVGFAFLNAIGIYTHYFYFFIAAAHVLYFCSARPRDRAKTEKFLLAFLCSLLLWLPWWNMVMAKTYNSNYVKWIFGFPGYLDKLRAAATGWSRYLIMANQPLSKADHLFLFCSAAFFVYIAFCALRDMAEKYRQPFFFCAIIFFTPLLGMLLIDIACNSVILKQERYWTFPLIGFIPFAGYVLSVVFSQKRLAGYLLILLMLMSSWMVSEVQFGPAPKHTSNWINKESGGKDAAVIVYNIRSTVLPQAYYLADGIYVFPVSHEQQLSQTLVTCLNYAERVFITHHYHRAAVSLLNPPFMGINASDLGFRLKGEMSRDDIKVTEFVK
jgi:uncharacterized membrane protein